MKIANWFLNNLGLKIISLLLAATTWFYVFNDIHGQKKEPVGTAQIFPSYGEMSTRMLRVKAIFIGELPAGYELLVDNVQIQPSSFIVAGPKAVIKNVDLLKTEPIDISRLKKTTIHEAGIAPIAPGLHMEKLSVMVTIPIKKVENK